MYVWVVLAVVALVARIRLVQTGIMYGDAAVTAATWLAGALCVLAGMRSYVSLRLRARSRHIASSTSTGNTGEHATAWGGTVVRIAEAATAIGVLITLVAGAINVVAPKDPPGLATPSCPDTRVWNAPYVGTNSPDDGVNARSGPARSYQVERRLAGNCSVGYSAYCLGDPILDMLGSGDGTHRQWVDTRWLVVATHSGFAGHVAHVLSGEDGRPQLVSESLVAVQRPYNSVPAAPAGICKDGYPQPGKAHLSPVRRGADGYQRLPAVAEHAYNIGFAEWRPTGQPFHDPGTYLQLYNPNLSALDNPGMTDAGGRKSAVWPYKSTLVQNLRLVDQHTLIHADVVVAAVPCLSDNVPADIDTMAMASYTVGSDNSLVAAPGSAVLHGPGPDRDQLARTACEAIV